MLPQSHPLASKQELTPADFHGENYISLSRTDSYRQLLDALFADHQVKRRMVVETHSASSVCAMVRAGVGISVVNPLTALDYGESGVAVRRFSVEVPFTVSLIRPLHRPGSALVETFIQHLQGACRGFKARWTRCSREHKRHRVRGVNRGGIEHRQRAALHGYQQANFGTAENDPFCALLRQRFNHLQVIIAGVVVKRAQHSSSK